MGTALAAACHSEQLGCSTGALDCSAWSILHYAVVRLCWILVFAPFRSQVGVSCMRQGRSEFRCEGVFAGGSRRLSRRVFWDACATRTASLWRGPSFCTKAGVRRLRAGAQSVSTSPTRRLCWPAGCANLRRASVLLIFGFVQQRCSAVIQSPRLQEL